MAELNPRLRRARLIHELEQISAGLAAGDDGAIADAREILRGIADHGSIAVLHDLFAGVLLVWDTEQDEFDQ